MTPPSAVLRLTFTMYRFMLWLYPRRFRREYGEEMSRVFRQMIGEAWRSRGPMGLLLVGLHAIADFVVSAGEQHEAVYRERFERLRQGLVGKILSSRLTARIAVLVLLLVPIGIASSSAFAKVELSMKHEEGSISAYKTKMKTHQVLTILGIPYETSGESTTTIRSRVGEYRPDGTLPIHNRIESIEAAIRLPGGFEIEFDSQRPDEGSDNPLAQIYFHLFRALSGSSHTAVLDGDNHVIAVHRAEAMLTDAPEMVRQLFSKQVDPEYLKQLSNQELRRLPERPVQKGETWARNETLQLEGGQYMVFTMRYQYLGTVDRDGETFDKIGITSVGVKYAVDPTSVLPLQIRQSDFAVRSSEGTLLFDRQRGRVVETSRRDHIQGELTMVINGVESPSNVDITLESNTVLVD